MKNNEKKSSCYEEAQKTIIKSKHKLIHLIGDYGIGKTYLLNSIINDEWKKEKVNNFDNFIFNEKQVELINSFEKNQDFQKRVKKYECLEKIEKLLWKFLGLWTTIMPIVGLLSKNIGIESIVVWFIVFLSILLALGISIFCKNKMNTQKQNEIWVFQNVDRFKWDVIWKLFQWAHLNKTNSKKIIFVYSTINLNERYKEKFGFNPSNLEIAIEKFVDEYVDLNLHKDDVAHKIYGEMLNAHKLNDKLDNSIVKSDVLNFRIIESCFIFIKQNMKIIELFKLDPNIVFLIRYLHFIDKSAYYLLKDNISLFEKKISVYSDDIKEYNNEVSSEKDSKDKILKKLNNSQISSKLIEMIYNKFYYSNEDFLSTHLKIYFISEETKKISRFIKNKKIKEMINKKWIPDTIKQLYLSKWFKKSSPNQKYQIFIYFFTLYEPKHLDFVINNYQQTFKKLDIYKKLNFIFRLLTWLMRSRLIELSFEEVKKLSKGFSFFINTIELLQNRKAYECENVKIIDMIKNLILKYWENILRFDGVFECKEKKIHYSETFLLLQINDKKVNFNVNDWKEFGNIIPYILVFTTKEEILNDKKVDIIAKNPDFEFWNTETSNFKPFKSKTGISDKEWADYQQKSDSLFSQTKKKFEKYYELLKNEKK